MLMPHPNLSDEVNSRIVESEIKGGVFLRDLPPSTMLHIQTMHHRCEHASGAKTSGAGSTAPSYSE
jgi:hypothetical protein